MTQAETRRSTSAFVKTPAKSKDFEVTLRLLCTGCEEWYDWTDEFAVTISEPPRPSFSSAEKGRVQSECPFCGRENDHEFNIGVELA